MCVNQMGATAELQGDQSRGVNLDKCGVRKERAFELIIGLEQSTCTKYNKWGLTNDDVSLRE